MLEDRIGQLSDMQRQCLRLAAEGRTSKEIAPVVGLTYNTVDQYLHRARVMLGAESRREAARMLVEAEGSGVFKRLELKSPDVVQPQNSAILEALTEQPALPPGLLGLPRTGGPPNDLTASQRLIAIGKIALFLMITVLAMIIVVKGAFVVLS